MTLDYTKTATSCELVARIIPAAQGQLWSPGPRWHGRQRDGTWQKGLWHNRHLVIIDEITDDLPQGERWDRFRRMLAFDAGQRQALRWLKKARDGGLLTRPDDYPWPDIFKVKGDLGCLCGQGCWQHIPARS
jgi:hypothetical protein